VPRSGLGKPEELGRPSIFALDLAPSGLLRHLADAALKRLDPALDPREPFLELAEAAVELTGELVEPVAVHLTTFTVFFIAAPVQKKIESRQVARPAIFNTSRCKRLSGSRVSVVVVLGHLFCRSGNNFRAGS
jgi:hypothetical protein